MKIDKPVAKHGGDIYTEGLFKNRKLLDFSSNVNPLGVPKSFIKNMDKAINAIERYPDIHYRESKRSIKEYLKGLVEEEEIILGNGAAEIIQLALSNFDKILIVVPSFTEYEECAKKSSSKIGYSYLDSNMELDYKDIKRSVLNYDALILGNPNNPNGGLIDKRSFYEILDICEENSIIVIVDEAFIEFAGNESLSFVEDIKSYNCLFIIRALTKFFALPGLRVGYGVSKNKKLIDTLKNKQIPWNINCFGELAILEVLKDEDYIKDSLNWIESSREILVRSLKDIEFIKVIYKSSGNFLLCRLKGITGKRLYEYCLKKDILIRVCDNYKGLDEYNVRFAVKDSYKNSILVKELKAIEKELKVIEKEV